MSVTAKEIKILRSLSTKKGRREQVQFVAEGVRLLEEAFRFGFLPVRLYANPSGLTDRGIELTRRAQRQNISVVQLSSRDLAKVSDTENSQGLLGVFAMPSQSLSELSPARIRTVLVCDRINDPGNLGTLIRSALAFGFEAVVLTSGTVEPFAPKTVRSSAGAVFGLPIVQSDVAEVLAWSEQAGALVVAADAEAHTELNGTMIDSAKPLLLAIGSEATGLDAAFRTPATVRCRIGHRPTVESLNAAMAGSILMKQIYDIREART